jgi:hypothetical protein
MANTLATGWWYLDTPGTAVIDPLPMYVKYVRWISVAASPGDQLILSTAAGIQWWEDVAIGPDLASPSPYFARNFPNAGSKIDDRLAVYGLRMPTLTSGHVYVYFDRQ